MKLEAQKILLMALVSIIIIQIGSIGVSEMTGVEVIKMGWAIMLLLLGCGMAVIITVSFQFGRVKREDILYLFVVMGIMVALFVYLPTYFPEMFQIFKSGIFSTVTP